MTQKYFTTLTEVGLAALTNATVLGQPLLITHFAVGDGGDITYNPDVETLKQATKLVNEVYRGAVNELNVDDKSNARYYIEGIVPVVQGGWTVREAGWFLDDGTLFAITKFPPSYKSLPEDGAATELPIRTYLATGRSANVQLKIDPTVVIASRAYVVDLLSKSVAPDSQSMGGQTAAQWQSKIDTVKNEMQTNVNTVKAELKANINTAESSLNTSMSRTHILALAGL